MDSYFFRFMNEDGTPTGRIGLTSGRTLTDVFWEIDQYGDPCSVQIHPVKAGSFCVHLQENEDQDLYEFSEVEFTENFPDSNSKNWKVPTWATEKGLHEIYSVSFGVN
ncbi:MAG: hypothetical protein RL661_886 [Pseudomonadota bacterium]